MHLPVASSTVFSGFILRGGLAAFALLTRPNRVHLRYGSRVRLPSSRQPHHWNPRSFGYMQNRQLHDELLPVHKISQAYPGTPRVSKRFLGLLPRAATVAVQTMAPIGPEAGVSVALRGEPTGCAIPFRAGQRDRRINEFISLHATSGVSRTMAGSLIEIPSVLIADHAQVAFPGRLVRRTATQETVDT